ncbi:tRNA1(Val) (adenine(37)-N6)-methyltransferase [Desertibacillus haloalkaliphilus]|uniref:tRNA1(Val) (adenine(37)-N6)-methyltransferase n=1 Tax=Desertibacillus haloalkaliphilus TaxID=1328930 RepID=UPI001C25FB06|nr:tRNA1(Val) (adenine(37)-N6)-methyltransferase [Desertibacillus haloalkaliphilus]MBU8908411.1 tRNA1(Val) (adenine(37)-N6)-methyltransferase [Desertibacillus haloalkaliphilus]
MVRLNKGERLDYLFDKELQVIQSHDVFSFSIDAVLLAKFTYVPIQKGKIVDLCTGNGVIPLVLSRRSRAAITGVEIQERLYDMAVRSVAINNLEDQLSIIHGDLKDMPAQLGHGQYDLLTCNPPYFETSEVEELNVNRHYAIARHEIMCSLDDVIRVSSQLVKQKGKVALVHRPERLADLITTMRSYRIEPKRVQMIYPKRGKEANIVLIEGIKDGQAGMKVLPSLIVYGEDNQYTETFKEIYYGK